MADMLRRHKAGYTRRQFFGIGGAGLALLAGREGFEYGREMLRQEQAWAAAAAPNREFLAEHAALFDNVTVGASFAPEQWSTEAQERGEPLAALDWAARDLGLRKVRLGLRWSRVEAQRGTVDLSPYRSMLDSAFGHGLEVCLNLGPIRTFRWPEEHLPGWLESSVELPRNGARIRAGSPLALASADYLERLLEALVSDYGAASLADMPMVQVENEPFYPLRTHKWVLDGAYVSDRIAQVQRVFPKSALLLTTAGRLNFGPIQDLIASMTGADSAYRGRFVMGFDYHYKTPLRDSFPVIRYTDPITFQRVGYQTCEENRRLAGDMDYAIEVTEGQAEPFGRLTEPGNSARHFRFMLLRCAGRVLVPGRPSVIRVWGIEEMAKKALAGEATPEHEAIFDLIRSINVTAPAPAGRRG